MTRCSVAEKSRPSMRVWYLPEPPKSASITANTRLGSQTTRPEPCSGRTLMTLKLVGTTSSRRKSPYFSTLTALTPTSTPFRTRSKMPVRRLRANRSLMISSVGMRPRTSRSELARS